MKKEQRQRYISIIIISIVLLSIIFILRFVPEDETNGTISELPCDIDLSKEILEESLELGTQFLKQSKNRG
jgi:hypothetical protein